MQDHNLLWAQNLPHSLSAPGHVSMSEGGHVKRLLACSLPRSDDCSLPDPYLVPACSKSVVISEYLSYTHCLALIYNPATRQTYRHRSIVRDRALRSGMEGRKEGRKQANRRGSKASLTTLDKRAKLFNGRQALQHISDDRRHIRANSDKLGLARCANLSTHRV